MSTYTPSDRRAPGPFRCGIYARFSSDGQKHTSIEDQIRNCREFAHQKGWEVLPEYIKSDEGISGASLNSRDGLLELLTSAKKDPPPIDCLLFDTTARYGRELSDVLKLSKIFHHHHVFLYFVHEHLDTRDPSARILQIVYGMKDEQDLETLRHNVHRGMTGAALKGYHTGGTHYGYRRILIYDPTKRDEHGREAVDHVILEVDREQAVIVLMIFELRASGMSFTDITKLLNKRLIPGPRGNGWSYTGVRTILNDELYRGIRKWNTTKTVKDPETWIICSRKRPEAEWIVKEQPELRIVSEDLWHKVQEVNRSAKGFGRQKLGGMNRTDNSRSYLFSGPLKCGVCFGSMNIIGGRKGGSRRVRYGCRAHRYEGKCVNTLTIRLDVLEEQLLSAIVAKLQPDVLEQHVDLLQAEVESYLKNQTSAGKPDEASLNERFAELKKEQSHVTKAIASYGQSEALFEELTRISAELKGINNQLAQITEHSACEVSFEEFRAFAYKKASDLKSMLQSDPALAKQAINKIIKRLVLTPVETPEGPVFEVSGDIDLFAGETCVLLNAAVAL